MDTQDTATVDRLEEVWMLADETSEALSAYLAAKQERDSAIRRLIDEGVTMYAIAQAAGISQQAIRKIRDAT